MPKEKIRKNKCKICGDKVKSKNKKVEYCSKECFMIYLNSKEFDNLLNNAIK